MKAVVSYVVAFLNEVALSAQTVIEQFAQAANNICIWNATTLYIYIPSKNPTKDSNHNHALAYNAERTVYAVHKLTYKSFLRTIKEASGTLIL